MSYNTYRTSGAAALAVSLAFNVDYDITDVNFAYQGRMTYEPYYTNTVNTGSWQSWNTLDSSGTGNWWASNILGSGACPIGNPCTWAEVLTNFPNIGVHSVYGAAVLKAGSSWASFDGNADALTIGVSGNDTTYDFEPECTTTCYVNTATGDDTFSGATPGSAKKTIQAAISSVSSGGTVNVYPGTYNQDEANGYDPNTGGAGSNDFNIFVNKPMTIRGVDGSGTPITNYNDVAAHVIAKRNLPTFGQSAIFVQADNVTITGLELSGWSGTGNNKTLEVAGDNVTVKYSKVHGMDSAAAVYISDWHFNSGTNTSHLQAYRIEGNLLDGGGTGVDDGAGGIRISSGAGWTGLVSGRVITGNTFTNTFDGIAFVGPGADPWDVYPVGAATITGNVFNVSARRHVIAWGEYLGGPGYANPDWQAIVLNNTFDKAAIAWTPGNDARSWDSPPFEDVRGIYSAIQRYAINKAQAGDTVQVLSGTYTEPAQIVISKNLSIVGAGAGTTIIKPSADTGSSGDARGWFLVNDGITFNLSNVTLDGTGRKVWQAIRDHGQGTISDCAFTNIKFEESGPSYAGTGIAAFGSPAMNVNVTNCTFSGIGRVGVLYFGSGVTGSTFSGNTYTGKGAGNWLDYAVEVGAGANATITRNTISANTGVASVDGSTSAGILVTTYFGAGTTANITENFVSGSTTGVAVGFDGSDTSVAAVYNNSLTGNTKGVESTAPLVDASANWWGTNTPGGVAAQVSASVDYSPWLHVGTDTDGGTPGFQGSFSVLHVDDNSPQAGVAKHIQEGIGLVSGSTVLVEPGTYNEALDIDSMANLTVDGTDESLVTLAPTTTLCWNVSYYGCGRQTVVRVVDSTDVTVKNMTMDFNAVKANFVFGVLYWNSTGELSGSTLKNMSVSDLSGGYYEFGSYLRAPDYTAGARADILVSGNTFVDAGRVAVLTHDYVDTTVTGNTFYKTTNDFGYAVEIGSTSTGEISNNTIYGYDTPAASDGSNSAGIYVENAFTWDVITALTKDVAITGNEVYDSQWGLYIGNEFDGFAGDVDIDVTMDDNNFHDNVDGGVLIADEDKESGSSVTVGGGGNGNTLTANGDYGYYIYTQGDGDITVDLAGETITGHDTGVYLEDTHGGPDNSSYDIAIEHGIVAGNTSYGMNNTVTGLTVQAEDNWWGACDGPGPVGPGSGDNVSANVDYNPWSTGPCDPDNDLLSNDQETLIYGTDPNDPDTDGDHCKDGREVLPISLFMQGGGRNPLNHYDYFNPSADGENRVDDILLVVDQYHKDDTVGTPGQPPYSPGYNPETDRTLAGPELWRTGPPNGLQRVDDILNAVQQYHHDCA